MNISETWWFYVMSSYKDPLSGRSDGAPNNMGLILTKKLRVLHFSSRKIFYFRDHKTCNPVTLRVSNRIATNHSSIHIWVYKHIMVYWTHVMWSKVVWLPPTRTRPIPLSPSLFREGLVDFVSISLRYLEQKFMHSSIN
jgi:hypothetical protein